METMIKIIKYIFLKSGSIIKNGRVRTKLIADIFFSIVKKYGKTIIIKLFGVSSFMASGVIFAIIKMKDLVLVPLEIYDRNKAAVKITKKQMEDLKNAKTNKERSKAIDSIVSIND